MAELTERAVALLSNAKGYIERGDQEQRRADEHKWAAAEAMWQAYYEEGASQREIARRLGIGATTARRYIAMWQVHGAPGLAHLPSFTAAFYEIADTPEAREDRAANRVLRERPDVIAEQIAADPALADALVANPRAQQRLEAASGRKRQKQANKRAAEQKIEEAVNPAAADRAQGLALQEAHFAIDAAVLALRTLRDKWPGWQQALDGERSEIAAGLLDTGLLEIEALVGELRGAGGVGDAAEAWLAQQGRGGA